MKQHITELPPTITIAIFNEIKKSQSRSKIYLLKNTIASIFVQIVAI